MKGLPLYAQEIINDKTGEVRLLILNWITGEWEQTDNLIAWLIHEETKRKGQDEGGMRVYQPRK